MTTPTVIFAGGGTGGHVFPALAIAESLRAAGPVRTVHIGSDRPLDEQLHADALRSGTADAVFSIPARPFALRPRGLARLVGSWGVCVRAVREIIRGERAEGAPVVMVAMGGFVAAPAAQAARAERVPVAMVNLDAVPGLANRWIARRASIRYAVVHEPGRPPGLAWRVVPPVVRAQIRHPRPPDEARAHFGLNPDGPTLLVTGGSQGARSVNGLMVRFTEAHAETLRVRGWQILHQAGPDDAEALAHHYTALGLRNSVAPSIEEMGRAWAAADAALGRAGAGTVAEAWATATPTLFLPYPYHTDDHQRLNARPLAEAGGAVIATDRIDPDANFAEHGEALLGMLTDEARRAGMAAALRGLGPADGAGIIAQSLRHDLIPTSSPVR